MSSETPALRTLYPPIEPFDEGMFKVSDLHTIHYEQSGKPDGKPVVVLHGGPGGGCPPYYRQFFDPAVYRVVLFDQRGAGQSLPHAELTDNTTWDLIGDIERLREHFGISKWVVFGGSWGSTLSLSYAIKHPDRVKALVLRGIFTLRRHELQWYYQEGASYLFPESFEKFKSEIPIAEHGDLMGAYHRRLTGSDEEVKLRCARAWSIWEMSTSRLYVDPKYIARASEDDKFALAFARIESHYFVHGGFFEYDGWILDNIDPIKHIPGVVVQGRYDVVCPAKSAYELSKKWSGGDLQVIEDAGHSMKEAGILSALVEGCDKYRDL